MAGVDEARALWLARHVLPHEPAVRAWLRRRPVPGLDVDDIIQETYAVLAARESVADVRDPRSYAFQAARSIVLIHLRRAKVVAFRALTEIELLGEIASEAPSPEEVVLHRDELRRLGEAIAAMPPKVRRAFTLRRVEGLSQKEIAVRLGVSENVVEKRIGQGIRELMHFAGRGGRLTDEASTVQGSRVNPFDAPRDEPSHRRRGRDLGRKGR